MAEPWQGKRLLSLSAGPHASVWVTEAADGRMWFGVTTPDGQASGSPLAADGISEMRIDKHRSVVVGQRVQDSLVEVRDKRQRSFPVSLGPGIWAAVVTAKTSLTVSFRDGGRLLRSDAWETMSRPLPLLLRLRGKGGASVIWRHQRS